MNGLTLITGVQGKRTSLWWAAKCGHSSIVGMLVDANVDIEMADHVGACMHRAVARVHALDTLKLAFHGEACVSYDDAPDPNMCMSRSIRE